MDPELFTGERVGAEERLSPGGNQRTASRRLPRQYRICMLLVLVMCGLHVLTAGSGAGSGKNISGHESSSDLTGLVSEPGASLEFGLGAGATSGGMVDANTPAAVCLNPLDATCWLQNAAQWMAQQVMGALQPVIGAIMRNPLNILTQTPPADTYHNPTVMSVELPTSSTIGAITFSNSNSVSPSTTMPLLPDLTVDTASWPGYSVWGYIRPSPGEVSTQQASLTSQANL